MLARLITVFKYSSGLEHKTYKPPNIVVMVNQVRVSECRKNPVQRITSYSAKLESANPLASCGNIVGWEPHRGIVTIIIVRVVKTSSKAHYLS